MRLSPRRSRYVSFNGRRRLRLRLEVLEERALLSVAPQTYSVTNLNDSGAGSLRAALASANSDTYSGSAFDTIVFDPSLAGGTIALTTVGDSTSGPSALAIAAPIHIDGSAAPGLVVARSTAPATPTFRIFEVNSVGNLTVLALTLSGGLAAANGTAHADEGGGLLNLGGTVTFVDVTVTGGSAGTGGGIANVGGTASFSDLTLAGNSASNLGGGLANVSVGVATLTNVTITNNAAGIGGGLGNSGTVTLNNTIVAGDFLPGSSFTAAPSEIAGRVSGGNNLVGDPASAGGLADGINGNIVGDGAGNPVDITGVFETTTDASGNDVPVLAANGGPADTVALVPDSPAIDAGSGSAPGFRANDERGIADVGAPDIGAYECRHYIITITGGNNQSAVVNSNFAQALSVRVSSQFGEPVDRGHVTFTGPRQGASTSPATTRQRLDRFGNASVTVSANNTSGPYTVTAAARGVLFPAFFSLSNTPGAAQELDVTGFPSSITAGVPGSLTVTAYDRFGNVATGFTGTVHFTTTSALFVLPPDYTFTTTDKGTHLFTGVELNTTGRQSISVSSGTLSGSQNGITVNSAAISTFTIDGFATPTMAGLPQNFTVTARDPFGNVATGYTGTVHFTSTDNQATLPPDYTFRRLDQGVHTFTVTFRTAGDQAIRVRDTTNEDITDRVDGIIITPASAASLALTALPNPVQAGVGTSFVVTAKDRFGNVATGYLGTVQITSSDPKATLPPDYRYEPIDGGTHTFTGLKLGTLGVVMVTASGRGVPAITPATGKTWVNPGTLASLTLANLASTSTAGVAQSFTVVAKDAYGNTATGYTGTVRFGSTDPQAMLPSEYAFTTTDAGKHAFGVTFKTAGYPRLTASDVATSIMGETGTHLLPAAIAGFSVSGFPSPIVAGAVRNFLVKAQDPYGNLVASYRGTVHFTSTDPLAVLPVNYTFTSADGGIHSFSATLETAGPQAITTTDTISVTITGTQPNIQITPAALSGLTIDYPLSTVAGTPQPLTVRAVDTFGNTVPTYTGTVTFTSTDAKAALPPNYTFTTVDAGVHTFSATLKTAGGQAIRARDTAHSTITAVTPTIAVSSASAQSLAIVGLPNPVTAGGAQGFTVQARDAYGNVATTFTGTVHFASTDPKATLPPNYTFTTTDMGSHGFDLVLGITGAQTVTAADLTNPSIATASARSWVNPGPMAALTIWNLPSTTESGVPQNVTVKATDAYGNLATGYTGTVQFTSTDLAASLPPNYNFTTADAGKHAFMITLNTPGYQSLTAMDVATGIRGVTSSKVVTPVPPTVATSSPQPPPSPGTPVTLSTSHHRQRRHRPVRHRHTVAVHPRGPAHLGR
jgi:hypothetical protein